MVFLSGRLKQVLLYLLCHTLLQAAVRKIEDSLSLGLGDDLNKLGDDLNKLGDDLNKPHSFKSDPTYTMYLFHELNTV